MFDGDDCVGWCQFGAPDEVPKIKNRAAYENSLTTLPGWRIACNFVGKGHRRQGVATAALDGALDLIARLGGGKVERYPETTARFPAGFLCNGALPTFEKLGFVLDRKIGEHRWVVTRVDEPTSQCFSREGHSSPATPQCRREGDTAAQTPVADAAPCSIR